MRKLMTRFLFPCGRYSILGNRMAAVNTASEKRHRNVPNLVAQFRMASSTSFIIPDCSPPPNPARSPLPDLTFLLDSLKRTLENMGMTVTETSRLRMTAQVTAMAMSLNSWPASSFMNTTGRNTATVVSVEARMAPQTSRVAS